MQHLLNHQWHASHAGKTLQVSFCPGKVDRDTSKALATQPQGHCQKFFVNGHKTTTKDQEQQSLYKLEPEQTSVRRSSASRFVVDCQG